MTTATTTTPHSELNIRRELIAAVKAAPTPEYRSMAMEALRDHLKRNKEIYKRPAKIVQSVTLF